MDDQVKLRQLPQGAPQEAVLKAVEERSLLVQLTGPGPACGLGTPVEVVTEKTIYLGIAESMQDEHLTISVEHRLQRDKLRAIQAVWKESHSE